MRPASSRRDLRGYEACYHDPGITDDRARVHLHRPVDLRLEPPLVALTPDLLAVTAGRTTLLITHDLDGLDQVDEIVVLEVGRVAERGTHAQLIGSGGAYQRLWEASL